MNRSELLRMQIHLDLHCDGFDEIVLENRTIVSGSP
jgi:hypothetical protein